MGAYNTAADTIDTARKVLANAYLKHLLYCTACLLSLSIAVIFFAVGCLFSCLRPRCTGTHAYHRYSFEEDSVLEHRQECDQYCLLLSINANYALHTHAV
jgi:hypothetical protein